VNSINLIKVGFYRPFYLSVLLLIFFSSCSSEVEQRERRYDYYPSKTTINYAKGFKVSYHSSYKIVDVFKDLDSTQIVQRYFLVEQGTKAPEMKEKDQMIRVPLASAACLSTTQVAYLSELKMVDKISGVGHASSIRDSIISKQIEKGWTLEITRSGQLDIELLLQANTTLLMANSFDQMAVSSLLELDIPVIYSSEYLENDVLARAEWIKFFALFFNAEKRATIIFDTIEQEYLATKNAIEEIEDFPVVMFGSYYQGTWYVPGGESLISGLFNDAGAKYSFSESKVRSNIHIDSESLIEKMDQIDYWGMILAKKSNINEDDFLAGDARMQQLAKEENLIFFYSNTSENDYFGKANLEPHIILKDLGKIFHPKLFPQHQFVYFQPYNE